MTKKMLKFLKCETILCIAAAIALVTCFIVPPDLKYLSYFEPATLVCLFAMLAVIAGLKSTHIFENVSYRLVSLFGTRRNVIMALVFGTFFLDMIVANDMSLITLLPLSYLVLHSTKNDKYIAITFILQTIAANMGGMITPYGNPQNLYLYSYYGIGVTEFIKILLPQFIATIILLTIACFLIPNQKLKLARKKPQKVDKLHLIIYFTLFVAVILSIFRIIPYLVTAIGVTVIMLVVDRSKFKEVDYGLLATFVIFFIISGNLSRIPAISEFVTNMVSGNILLAGILSCQFISNVPTAILLSKFTAEYQPLVVAVNIGSLGILMSSLASLITLKHYTKYHSGSLLKYLGTYTVVNGSFMAILVLVTLWVS